MYTSLVLRDKSVIWHPFTNLTDNQPPIPIASAKGAVLFDEQGNTYIDAISSWWVNLHGHAHPHIANKIFEQASTLEHIIFAGFTHRPAVELAERLLKILPGNFSKVFYSDNGSTSTEVALKMALQYWWNKSEPRRKKILAFSGAYHGDTFGAMSASDRGVFTLAFHDLLFEVIFIDPPATEDVHVQLNTILENENEIAAFIYEPLLQGAGGMHIYSAAGLDLLLQSLQSMNIICIADEVMTGFGRTGTLFASERMSAKPDIICLSKGLTGGTMPLGVTACRAYIQDAFVSEDRLKTFFHGHSFTANPLGCAAALASLDLLEKEECREGMRRIEKAIRQFLITLSEKHHGSIKNARSLGTLMAFELNTGKNEYLNTIGAVVTQMALSKGVYLRPLGNTLYILPPYCITEDQLAMIFDTIFSILESLKEPASH